MGCMDTERLYLKPDHLNYCGNCAFRNGGKRTLCVEHQELKREANIVFVPRDFDEVVGSLHQIELVRRMSAGVRELMGMGFTPIVSSQESRDKYSNGFGFAITVGEGRRNDEEIKRVLQTSGIKIPQDFRVSELIRPENIAIVAKNTDVHSGGLKFLLEGREQKAKFLSWLLLNNRSSDFFKSYTPDALFEIATYFVKEFMDNPNFDGYDILDLDDTGFEFQEYIAGPSRHASSFRVVVSAFGEILYAGCLVSPKDKSRRRLSDDHLTEEDPLSVVKRNYPDNEAKRYDSSRLLLTHSKSPLFLDTHDIVSNFARGSKPVILNGKQINDRFLREELRLLGIDPDNPRLSDELVAISSELGRKSRYIWPYIGIDWIKDSTGNLVYLETNRPPALVTEMVSGSNVNMDQIALQNQLIRNIVNSRSL